MSTVFIRLSNIFSKGSLYKVVNNLIGKKLTLQLDQSRTKLLNN